jgi:phenylacetate-CoA ligase
MSSGLLKLYHRMPPFMRSLAASARGYALRGWRYGPESERLIEEIQAREAWSAAQWRDYQEKRLGFVLHRAATQVPYYRDQWAARRRSGDHVSWEVLANWPILEKDEVREHAQVLVADDCDARKMYHEHTSGTTGKSLDLWWSRDTVRLWYAFNEARWRGWYGVTRRDRWAILGGQLVTPAETRKPPFWVWNAALNQLYMSSYHLASDLIPHYLDALERHRVTYLWGYTSSLYALAQEALRLNRRVPMRVAITNAEPVFDYQREAIRKAFQCPVRETYGMAEIVMAAGECEADRLHLWPDVGVVETVEGDQPALIGVVGDFVATGLINADMPLIRYRIGDRGALAGDDACTCGRHMPLLASIEGRADDVLITSDGRRIGRLDPIFKARLPVREAQIIQEALDRVRVKYIPADDFTPDAEASMIERLRDRMGDVQVVLERVDAIPRTANGKFRAVINAMGDG